MDDDTSKFSRMVRTHNIIYIDVGYITMFVNSFLLRNTGTEVLKNSSC